MKNLTSLVQLEIVEDNFDKNKISFYQYYDDVAKTNEYKILDQNKGIEHIVSKDEGNNIYKDLCKRAIHRMQIV